MDHIVKRYVENSIFFRKTACANVFYKTKTALEFYLLQHPSCIEVVEEGNEWSYVKKIVFTFAFNHSEDCNSSSGSNGTSTSLNLFTFSNGQEDITGSFYTSSQLSGETGTQPSGNETIPEEPRYTYSPQPQPQKFNSTPLVIGGIIAISIVLVTAYKRSPKLKHSKKAFNKRKEPKTPDWKKRNPLE